MEQRRPDGSTDLTDDVRPRDAHRALREAFAKEGALRNAPDLRPKMVALHAPGSVVETHGVTRLRRKNGSVEEVPPGRYVVQDDGTWRALGKPMMPADPVVPPEEVVTS